MQQHPGTKGAIAETSTNLVEHFLLPAGKAQFRAPRHNLRSERSANQKRQAWKNYGGRGINVLHGERLRSYCVVKPATESCIAKARRQNPERGGWLGGCGTLGNCSHEASLAWTENLQIVPSSQITTYWLLV
jgi:hypothetical protein